MKVGILGGTFNPIHYGHLRAAEEVREKLSLDKIIFIPAGSPPLKSRDLAPEAHRMAMTSKAVLTNPCYEVSDIEISRKGKSYTVDTLRKLKELYPADEFFFIMGVDAFMDLHLWKEPDTLISLADFVVIPRPPMELAEAMMSPYLELSKPLACYRHGVLSARLKSGRAIYFIETALMYISSTEIRWLLRKGRSIKYLLPQEVESYIISHGLYKGRQASACPRTGRRVPA